MGAEESWGCRPAPSERFVLPRRHSGRGTAPQFSPPDPAGFAPLLVGGIKKWRVNARFAIRVRSTAGCPTRGHFTSAGRPETLFWLSSVQSRPFIVSGRDSEKCGDRSRRSLTLRREKAQRGCGRGERDRGGRAAGRAQAHGRVEILKGLCPGETETERPSRSRMRNVKISAKPYAIRFSGGTAGGSQRARRRAFLQSSAVP